MGINRIVGKTIGDVVRENAERFPDKIAAILDEEEISYRQFNNQINKVANTFTYLGIKKGDRVAVLLNNSFEILYCYFANGKLGSINVLLNPALRGRELLYILQDCKANTLVLGSEFMETVKSILNELTDLRTLLVVGDSVPDGMLSFRELMRWAHEGEPLNTVQDKDPVIFLYTSGTTGRPKGVMLSHFNALSTGLVNQIAMQLTEEDRVMLVAPLFHSAALHTFMMSHNLAGGSFVIVNGFKADKVVERMQTKKVTVFFGVPAMWNMILQLPHLKEYDLSALRIGFTGAAPMSTETKKQILETFPNFELIDGYGLTETGPVGALLMGREIHMEKPGSIGKPWPYTEVKIFDSRGEEARPGEIGEIVIRGISEMLGYYNLPEATTEAFRGGWLHTGDLGTMDEEGYIYIKDRTKDMLIRGGVNVYPREVEEVLFTHPKILEAAVIGVPDSVMGEEPLAVVTLKEGQMMSAEEVIAFCSSEMADYKVPRYVVFSNIPRNASGKVLKVMLREEFRDSEKQLEKIRVR